MVWVMSQYSRAALLYVVYISVFNMPPFKDMDGGTYTDITKYLCPSKK